MVGIRGSRVPSPDPLPWAARQQTREQPVGTCLLPPHALDWVAPAPGAQEVPAEGGERDGPVRGTLQVRVHLVKDLDILRGGRGRE